MESSNATGLIYSLSLVDWGCLLAVLCFFLGPGYALLNLCYCKNRLEWTQRVTLSISLSIAFWSILLVWFNTLGIKLNANRVTLILGLSWLVVLARARPRRLRIQDVKTLWSEFKSNGNSLAILLWGIFVSTAVVRLWALRDSVVGPGSDSYHHTLIAHMIVNLGKLPDSYEPFAPLETFTYHFGFHGLAAAVAWLTGLQVTILVPILAQVLSAVTALSVAFFTQLATSNRSAAVISALITGLVSVFPAFLINWGRYAQLAGLVILPTLLGLIWEHCQTNFAGRLSCIISLLAAGLVLVHYRITLMAASAIVTFVAMHWWPRRLDPTFWKLSVRWLGHVATIAVTLLTPWILHILAASRSGYPTNVGTVTRGFFELKRLGPGVLSFPTNCMLIVLTVLGILRGFWQRERVIIALSIWIALMLLLSIPCLVGVFMDTISVLVSLFFPASVAVGWWIVAVTEQATIRFRLFGWALRAVLALLTIQGVIAGKSIVDPDGVYVGPDDLVAMEWIRNNTPASAYFMTNTFHWEFLPGYVIGPDAGYWLPLLSGRRAVTVPMTYVHERSSIPDLAERLVALDQLNGHITSPEALALLRREGVTYVYIGQRGGPIAIEEVMNSPYFQLEYQYGAAYVFRLR